MPDSHGSSVSLMIPASAEGIALAWSLMRCGVQTPEVQWCAPIVNPAPQRHMHLISRGLGALQRSRLRRLLRAEHDRSTSKQVLAFHAAARACRIDLAFELLCRQVLADEMEPDLLARGVLLSRFEDERLDRAMIGQQCWRPDAIDVRGLPATLVPPFVRELRRIGLEERIGLLSGGHVFAPGCWRLVFAAGECSPSSVHPTELTYGQIFQPDSARMGHEGQYPAGQHL